MGFRTGPSEGTKGNKLTPKMRSFISEYMVDLNATQAVLRSDYSTNGQAQATRLAAELMAHPLIKEEIGRRLDKKDQRVEVRSEYLLNKLLNIIEDDTIKTQDKLRAIELAGKSIALWKERQEISGPDGGAIAHEQHVKESVADFTSRISRLAQRNGTDGSNVIPIRGGDGGTEVAVEVLGTPEPDRT